MLCKLIAIFSFLFVIANCAENKYNTVCYYDSRAFGNEGLAKVTLTELEPALPHCTHLVYGWAGINDNKKVISLNVNQDLDNGKALFRLTTQLKRKFPGLKILLGVGGDAQETYDKWLELLESSVSRISFINSAYDLVKTYGFDGLDLAFEFPKIKPKKIRSSLGSVWHSFKKTVGAAGNPVDPKSDEHKEEFSSLIRELKNSFRPEGYILSVTMNPNVNASLYFDSHANTNNVDFLNLAAFDFITSERNKKEVDYTAPIYTPSERNPELNVDSVVGSLIKQEFPSQKINIGIPTYGRTWEIEADSTKTGVPPMEGNGPAPEGIQSKTPGLLTYPEICNKLVNNDNMNLKGENAPLRKTGDPSKRFGTYAFRLPDSEGKYGMWVGYEDPDFSGHKADYAKKKNLGGVAIFDLTKDDFRGACSGDKFPILKAARYKLVN